MPEDREERHIKAFIDSLRRAVETDLPDEDVDRLAAAALGDEDAAEEDRHRPSPDAPEPDHSN